MLKFYSGVVVKCLILYVLMKALFCVCVVVELNDVSVSSFTSLLYI